MSLRVLIVGGAMLVFSACSRAPMNTASTSSGVLVSISNTSSSRLVSRSSDVFGLPMSDALKRVTKKIFGLYVTPRSSPISPERFTGYHTGIDFETTADEKDRDIVIAAICSGRVVYTDWVKGYGGVLVQRCLRDKKSITILYGHLKSYALKVARGDMLKSGEPIGLLGQGYSQETDGERKHLHLGIHLNNEVDLRGYVLSKKMLSEWIDPMTMLQK